MEEEQTQDTQEQEIKKVSAHLSTDNWNYLLNTTPTIVRNKKSTTKRMVAISIDITTHDNFRKLSTRPKLSTLINAFLIKWTEEQNKKNGD